MEKQLIQYSGAVPDVIRKRLYSELPDGFELEFLNEKKDPKEKEESLKKTSYIMGFPRGFTEEMRMAPHLKLVQLLSAGYDSFDVATATELGIPVANNGGANSVAVAEHSVLLILALYKKLNKHTSGLKEGKWVRDEDHPLSMYELSGKEVGIVGFGNIGKGIARRLKGFDAKLSYYDVVMFPELEEELDIEFCSIEEILKKSDIISLHVPFLKSTENMISEKQLKMMKKNAILINTARGELVDEEALYTALKEKWIAGAGLDVFRRERDVARGTYSTPLTSLDNAIITPHYAGHTYDTWLRRIEKGYENIVRTAKGERPSWVVNRKIYSD